MSEGPQTSFLCCTLPTPGKCLSQLSFSDAPSVQDCFMYRLAHQTNLAGFKFVLLVTSTQVGSRHIHRAESKLLSSGHALIASIIT